MWVTKLLIFPVEIRIFCPKTTKFGPKLAFLINLGQAMQAYSMPRCESVGGCGARAVSRKTSIYFIIIIMVNDIIANPRSHYRYNWQWDYVQKYAEAHHKNLLQVFVVDQANLSFRTSTYSFFPRATRARRRRSRGR